MGVIRQEHDMASGRFIALRKLEYVDRRGVLRSWESADRVNGTPRSSNRPSAVLIIARIVPDNELLLVRQFRPPAGKLMVEFPAGLIDPGEDIETTAHRELYEETGYQGRFLFATEPGYSSPGLTGESVALCAMEIDGNNYPEIPENHQEECEDIEVFRVPISKLADFVAEQERSGCGVDSKLHTLIAMQKLGW
jgi:8-oxo-dGTP pyrophosphatase MutT (NUDIX family)